MFPTQLVGFRAIVLENGDEGTDEAGDASPCFAICALIAYTVVHSDHIATLLLASTDLLFNSQPHSTILLPCCIKVG